jgi:CRP-like cAMP-binding protein/ATP/ADP translocase/HEAT repeat protein
MQTAPGHVTSPSGFFDAFASALSIRPGEGRRSALLFAHLFLASSVFILGRTVRDTLFLSRYSLAALPWMFVLYGVASSITAVFYSRYADKLPRHRAIALVVGAGVVTYIGVWALVRAQMSWVYPAFYVWSEVVANLLIVQFWTLANDLHDARSAKRLFPVVGAARVLGVVVIGTTTGAIVSLIGTTQLLFVLVAMMLGIAAIAAALSKERRVDTGTTTRRGAPPKIMADPYVRSLAVLILLTFAALTVGDYQFKAIAKATYKEDALARFFSLFYAGTGIVSFLFQVFLTPRILGRFGVGVGMSVMPGVFGAASIALPFVPSLAIASAMKFADNGFQYTIHETSLQALYVPFAAHVKARTRAILDAAIKPLAYGTGGLLLIVAAPRLSVPMLSAVTSVLVLLWLAMIPVVRRRYLFNLKATLSARGALALEGEAIVDAATRDTLRAMLDSKDERQALLALEHLGEERGPEITAQLVRLLGSSEAHVRAAALDGIATAEGARASDVAPLLRDPDDSVRAAAARAYAAIAGDECVTALDPLVVDGFAQVRVAALAGLLQHGGIEGDISAGARLSQLLVSDDRDARVEAAQVLGQLGRQAYRPIRRMLGDTDPVVRRAALRACAGVADARLVPDLVERLSDRACTVRAGSALVAIGAAAVPSMLSVLRDGGAPREVRLQVARLLRGIADKTTYERLRACVDVSDSHLRLRIYATLSRLRETLDLPPEPIELVTRLVQREVGEEFTKLAAWSAVRARYETPLLAEELSFREQRAVRRVLRILELRLDPGPLRLVRERLDDPRRRANALEVLDAELDPQLRRLVMLFVDDAPLADRVRAAGSLVKAPPGEEDLLREEASHPNPYVALLALDAVAAAGAPFARELAIRALSHPAPLVREGGILALRRVAPDVARERLPALANDPDPIVQRFARAALAAADGDTSKDPVMHSTIEKILFLKSTSLFSGVASEDLAPLARVASVETFAPGTRVVSEGEVGDRLFIVISGKVGVSVHGKEVAQLGPGEAFGEMAVLDASPRSATVTAADETVALSIGSEEFYEILHEQVEIAEGVIRTLTRRLREANIAREADHKDAAAALETGDTTCSKPPSWATPSTRRPTIARSGSCEPSFSRRRRRCSTPRNFPSSSSSAGSTARARARPSTC